MEQGMPLPLNERDRKIGEYILKNAEISLDSIDFIRYLSSLACGFIAWYPFKNGKLLQTGSDFGAYSELLCRRCDSVDVIEEDSYRAYVTGKRYSEISNLSVINCSLDEYLEGSGKSYDYILYNVDIKKEKLPDIEFYRDKIKKLRKLLKPLGKLIIVLPNRFGAKYFCGEPNYDSKIPFDGMTENNSLNYLFSRRDLVDFLNSLQFKNFRLYYPFPDTFGTQTVYSDEIKPGVELCERFSAIIESKGTRVLNEKKLMMEAAKNDAALFFADSFIVECTDGDSSKVDYATLSNERIEKNAFATDICNDGKVVKIPLYSEGEKGLKDLINNCEELYKRGVPVVIPQEVDGTGVMKRILLPVLSAYLRNLVLKGDKNILDYTDKLYEYILKSSNIAESDKNIFKDMDHDVDWGPILETAYLEMIPVNCFFDSGEFLFFDQEYVYENCPAKYVLFRAISDIYNFIPEIKTVIPVEEMKKRYGMEILWEHFKKIEAELWKKLVRKDIIKKRELLSTDDDKIIRMNREALKLKNIGESIFDVVSNLDGKSIVLFGSGRYCDYYLDKYGDKFAPAFIADNDSSKWGTFKNGIEIKSPEKIAESAYGTYRVIITAGDYLPIISQLKEMNISDEFYRVYSKLLEDIAPGERGESMLDGKYNIGYVTGVFDLFHIGHLNILRRSKERCHYLIAGVVNDEITKKDKGKEPFIPLSERIEIIKQCKFVDRVVEIDEHNTDKIDAWKELHYDCLFSGSDHETEPWWIELQQQLRRLGSNLEFFPYTKSTSSTILQEIIKRQIKEN